MFEYWTFCVGSLCIREIELGYLNKPLSRPTVQRKRPLQSVSRLYVVMRRHTPHIILWTLRIRPS